MSSKTFVRGRKIHDMERAHFRLTITYPLSKTVHFFLKIVFTWLESIYIWTHPSAILCYLISIWVGSESQHLFWSSCNQIKEIANLANSILFDIAVQHDSMLTQIPKAMHQKIKNIICQRSFNRASEKVIHSLSTATKLHLYKSRFVAMLFEWIRFFWCCSKKPIGFAVLIK